MTIILNKDGGRPTQKQLWKRPTDNHQAWWTGELFNSDALSAVRVGDITSKQKGKQHELVLFWLDVRLVFQSIVATNMHIKLLVLYI